MQTLEDIFTDEARQSASIILLDNTTFSITLYYRSLTSGWYCDIKYDPANFDLRGIKITNNLNILHPFRNKLNFGLSFIVPDGGELWYQDDFISGRVLTLLLDKNDIENFVKPIYEI
jgi:hypothetical protein